MVDLAGSSSAPPLPLTHTAYTKQVLTLAWFFHPLAQQYDMQAS